MPKHWGKNACSRFLGYHAQSSRKIEKVQKSRKKGGKTWVGTQGNLIENTCF